MSSQTSMKIVAYHRVSTDKQGQSGLGLEAQENAINNYVTSKDGAEIVASFTEIESGKNDKRPELLKALHLAEVTGATLVIAKLDRLSRDAAFLITLQNSHVKFIAADMPEANEFTVGIMALVAQQEREAISKRTKEALAVTKANGKKLGNPYGNKFLLAANKGNKDAVAAIKSKADHHAQRLAIVIDHIKADGITSLLAISKELNARGMQTPRGGKWYPTSVKNLLARI